MRQDVIVRFWGSESILTKEAYDKVNMNPDKVLDNPIEVQIGG